MITSKKGIVEYKGTKIEIKTDITVAIIALYNNKIFNDEELDFIVKLVKKYGEKEG